MKSEERARLSVLNKRLTSLINLNLDLIPITKAIETKAEIQNLIEERNEILRAKGEILAEQS